MTQTQKAQTPEFKLQQYHKRTNMKKYKICFTQKTYEAANYENNIRAPYLYTQYKVTVYSRYWLFWWEYKYSESFNSLDLAMQYLEQTRLDLTKRKCETV